MYVKKSPEASCSGECQSSRPLHLGLGCSHLPITGLYCTAVSGPLLTSLFCCYLSEIPRGMCPKRQFSSHFFFSPSETYWNIFLLLLSVLLYCYSKESWEREGLTICVYSVLPSWIWNPLYFLLCMITSTPEVGTTGIFFIVWTLEWALCLTYNRPSASVFWVNELSPNF